MKKEYLLNPALKIILALIFLFPPVFHGQQKKLTYKQVYEFRPPRLLNSLPRISGWLDAEHYLEVKTPEGKTVPALMKVNAADGSSSVFLDYEYWNQKLPEAFSLERDIDHTDDYSKFLFKSDVNLYFFSLKEEMFKRLTEHDADAKNATLSPNGEYAAYTMNNNLYVVDVATEKEKQLTFDGSDDIYNGRASWVYYEEILGRGSRYKSFWWSPNSEMIAFLWFDDTPVPKFPLFNADGVHGELEWERYPKAGDPDPKVKLGIAHIKTGDIIWVDLDENTDKYVAWPFWTPDSRQLFFQWMNRAQDNLIIYSTDPMTGSKKEIYNEKQSAWVEFFEDIYMFKDGSGFLLRSDVDGWGHLYYYDLTGKLISRLTQGEWSVSNIEYVDENNKVVYFQGNKDNSTESHLFKVDLDGNNFTKITSTSGTHRASVSPGGKYFYDRFSSINEPSKLELFKGDGEFVRLLGDSKSEIFDQYKLGETELFSITTEDGITLPAEWTLPPDFDKSKKYPVIFSVYGGPGTTDVRNSFPYWLSSYYLAQNDIIIFSVDHRGSSHFGKKGMIQMHRNLGKWEMNDYIEAVKWLRKQPFIDSSKIAMNGGSYGGYVTCMALTYGADYFNYGIAEYSVTDWRLYDNVYTERYMDTPEENPEGYKFGSTMTHADNYKGYLLITHGTMDDNVHMQNTIQLIDKLTDLNKDFEMMLYPNARHGVGYPKRRHAARETVRFWFNHLLNKELSIDED